MANKKVERVDMREPIFQQTASEMTRCKKLCFKINHTEPMTEEVRVLEQELFAGKLPETSFFSPPFQIDLAQNVKVGKNVFVNNDFICMARGGVEIEDDVMIAPRVSVLTANHDLHDHSVLLCSSVRICKNAWIGSGAIILPGVTVGENAIVAAGAIVTKDVSPNTVVGGNPAKVLKEL